MGGEAKIGLIGAGGWLGRAFCDAILSAGIASAGNMVLSYRSTKPDLHPDAIWTTDNQLLFDRAEAIVVSVRPEDFASIQGNTQGKLIISVMVGVTASELAARFRTDRIVRALPNAGAEVGMSYTPWFARSDVPEEDCRLVQRILDACGVSDRFDTEDQIDYLTGLTGSGPAFPALLATAMMNDAISRGIKPEPAARSVRALLVGTGRLLDRRADCPSDLVQTFLDYRGTTAAAIEAMREAGFDRAIAAGLEAALAKAISMGRPSGENTRHAPLAS